MVFVVLGPPGFLDRSNGKQVATESRRTRGIFARRIDPSAGPHPHSLIPGSLFPMSSKPHPRPTDSELSVLMQLWARGPQTVRQVYEEQGRQRNVGYTTVLKIMQIMAGKGLVRRDTAGRSHVYTAEVNRERTQGELVGELVDKAFGGSASQLVMRALSSRRPKEGELAEIRRWVARLEAEEGRGTSMDQGSLGEVESAH